MGDHNVVLMCLIFLLAGGFVEVSKAIGAVDAIVSLGIGNVHPALLLPGLFVVAGFISLSLGTSMGTIAAVAPIALGVSDASGLDRALVLGAVIGGATFGDNLSVISDTAIVASRTQGCTMREKFRENLKLALPAALLTLVVLGFVGDTAPVQALEPASPWLILPYVVVLGLAMAGVDVIIVLGIGLVMAGVFGAFFADDFGLAAYADPHLGRLREHGRDHPAVAAGRRLGRADEGHRRPGLAGAGHRPVRARPQQPPRRRSQHRRAFGDDRRVHRQQHGRDPDQRRAGARHRRSSTACRRLGRRACSTSSPASRRACCRMARRSCWPHRWARCRRWRWRAKCTTLAAGRGHSRLHAVARAKGATRAVAPSGS